MNMDISPIGELRLGHLLTSCGVEPADALVMRHTYDDTWLRRGDVSVKTMLAKAGLQKLRFGSQQPALWINFIADGGRRARFWGVFENHGELVKKRDSDWKYFDLRESTLMSSLSGRLVVEWPDNTIVWRRKGSDAATFPVLEIADPRAVPFPGYDRVVLDFATLREVVDDPRYVEWRTALQAVQGVYLITDSETGWQYVGKADGAQRILQRWSSYAKNGHGGNVAMKSLIGGDLERARSMRFSLLRVFGPHTPARDVDETEEHFKRALMSREWGLNL